MAGLLVSVRSVAEARAALAGGAAVIDIKEPALGPLGRASSAIWGAIRAAVPADIPMSVALGELVDLDPGSIPPEAFPGITFRKAGPARLRSAWGTRWAEVRRIAGPGPAWVAVIYADHDQAEAPTPDEVIATALQADDCVAVLVDSWDKSSGCPITDLDLWSERIEQVQASGRMVALAGRLDLAAIHRLGPLRPDLFAVRGAACAGGRRDGLIQAELVAQLAAAARGYPTFARSSR